MILHPFAKRTSVLLLAAIFLCGCVTEKKGKDAEELVRVHKRADSLKASHERLAQEKKEIEKRLRTLEEDKNILATKADVLRKELKEGKRKAAVTESKARQDSLVAAKVVLQASQDSLQKEVITVADSIETVKGLLVKAEEQAKHLAKQTKYASGLEEKAEVTLRSGVTQIDLTLDELGKEKRQAQERIALNEKRTAIAQKKIAAFEEERSLYLEEKSRLMRENASKIKMRKVELRIAEIDNEIAGEKSLITETARSIANSRNHIQGIDATVDTLQRKIERQYDRKDILADFVLDDMQRLKAEKERVVADRQRLLAEQNTLMAGKQALERKIAGLGEEIQLLEGKGIADIEGRKAFLEKEEADVVAEEAAMLEAASKEQEEAARARQDQVDERDTSAEGRLADISRQVAAEKAEVAKEEAGLAKQRKDVSQEEAEVAQRRAEESSGWAWLPWVIIIIVLTVAASLYFIGKVVRSKRVSA